MWHGCICGWPISKYQTPEDPKPNNLASLFWRWILSIPWPRQKCRPQSQTPPQRPSRPIPIMKNMANHEKTCWNVFPGNIHLRIFVMIPEFCNSGSLIKFHSFFRYWFGTKNVVIINKSSIICQVIYIHICMFIQKLEHWCLKQWLAPVYY